MRKVTLTLLGFCLAVLSYGQPNSNEKLIELGKAYKDFMFRNEPTKGVLREVKINIPENLQTATDFIVQTITKKNKLLTRQFLSRPDDQTLKQIFIIRAISLNLREEQQIDNKKLIDSLVKSAIPTYELVDNYYGMLFTAVGNKNQPFNLSKIDFLLNGYNLKDDTEKGILFLRCMNYCGNVIWGYMNFVKPANTQTALAMIKKYPKFNGRSYYQYADFYFADFELSIIQVKEMQSYKSYYLDKYYEVLLSHLICLDKEGGTEEAIKDLLFGSILKERNLYKYTKYKETLESLFREQEKE